jgi:hypothetical protein
MGRGGSGRSRGDRSYCRRQHGVLYKTHRKRVKVGKFDDISMFKRIILKWDGDHDIERPAPANGGLVDCYRGCDSVAFR